MSAGWRTGGGWSPKTILAGVVTAAVLAVGAGTVHFLRSDRVETLKHFETMTADSARFLEEHARRTIHAADLVVLQAVELIGDRGGPAFLDDGRDWRVFHDLANHLPEKGFLWVFDSNGESILGTLGFPSPKVNVRDREYFQAHAEENVAFHIGPAIRGRARSNVVFTISRALRGEDGALAAVVLAGVEVEYFTKLYDLLDSRLDPLLGIYRADGEVLVRRPDMEQSVGRNVAQGAAFRLLADGRAATYEGTSPQDGVLRILSARRVQGLPLIVVAGIAKEAALAEWRVRAVRALWLSAGALGILLMLGRVGWAAIGREERSRSALESALAEARASERRAVAAVDELAGVARRNALFAAAIEASPGGIVITEAAPEPTVLYTNTAFEQMTGYSAQDIVGQSIRVLYGPETDVAAAAAIRDAKARGAVATVEMRNYRKDGSTFWNRVRIAPVLDGEGRTIAHVSILWDTTDEHRREAEERQRQKMEALGQLAGGIAHEINNLLQPIVSLASLNLRHPGEGEALKADLTDMLDSARQCREVVGSVLAFARREGTASAPLCLDEAVRYALTLARSALGPAVQVEEDIRVAGARALVGRTELTQVLTNLLTNAADAMDGAGRVTVTLEEVAGGSAPAFRLTVRDEGCGMDEAEQQRIFEPFFTTKGLGHGTGLGLSVVHGIVRSWNGSIAVRSARGQGAAFEVTIPAAAERIA